MAARFEANGEFHGYRGTGTDVTAIMRAQEEHERLRQLEANLAHISRVTMMGELAAALAHEIKQPISAALMNAKTCMRWLRRDTPDVTEACEAAARLIRFTGAHASRGTIAR